MCFEAWRYKEIKHGLVTVTAIAEFNLSTPWLCRDERMETIYTWKMMTEPQLVFRKKANQGQQSTQYPPTETRGRHLCAHTWMVWNLSCFSRITHDWLWRPLQMQLQPPGLCSLQREAIGVILFDQNLSQGQDAPPHVILQKTELTVAMQTWNHTQLKKCSDSIYDESFDGTYSTESVVIINFQHKHVM